MNNEDYLNPIKGRRKERENMKLIRKLLTLTVALFMMIGLGTAVFAEDPPAYDYPLTVTGLAEGDTVKFYQVVEWVGETDDDSDVSGWKAVSTYSSVLTKDVLKSMLVGDPDASPAVAPTGMTS